MAVRLITSGSMNVAGRGGQPGMSVPNHPGSDKMVTWHSQPGAGYPPGKTSFMPDGLAVAKQRTRRPITRWSRASPSNTIPGNTSRRRGPHRRNCRASPRPRSDGSGARLPDGRPSQGSGWVGRSLSKSLVR